MSFTTANSRQVTKILERAIAANLVLMITSSPGAGKSSLVRQVADKYNLKLIDNRMTSLIPEDFSGLPRFTEDGKAEFVQFSDMWPLEGQPLPMKEDGSGEYYDGWLLFMDEFNSGTKGTLAASYKLLYDRQVGQKNLHPNVVMALAGNRMGDRAIVNNIGTALESRISHVEMEVVHNIWLEDVALPLHFDHRVVAFLQVYPSHLDDFKPNHNGATFCCPRTWESVSKYCKSRGTASFDEHDRILLSGTITAEVAAKFVQFTKIYDSMVTVNQVVSDPQNAPLPQNIETTWATVMAMAEGTTAANYDKVMDYIERLEMGFRVIYTRTLMAQQPKLRSHSRFIQACININQYLTG